MVLAFANERGLTCTQSLNLPTVDDCRDLSRALYIMSTRPTENRLKRWGPSIPDGSSTAKVPKLYFLVRTESGFLPTCVARIDYLPRHSQPDWDEFRLRVAVFFADAILESCLMQRALTGYNFPGPRKTIFISLARYQFSPVRLLALAELAASKWNVTIGNRTLGLYELTGENPISSDLQSHDSNLAVDS